MTLGASKKRTTLRPIRESPDGHLGLTEVVAACRSGDRDAQHRLYEACHEAVYRLILRMVGLQDAADVLQQVFLRGFRNIDQFQGNSRFETWLYRLAVNECFQHLRARRRGRFVRLEHEPMDQGPQQHRGEGKELLEAALARLDADLRSVFLLREVEGLSYREMSRALGISEGTVASRLNRARRRLKEILAELGWES